MHVAGAQNDGAAARLNEFIIDELQSGADVQSALFRAQRKLLDEFNKPMGLVYTLYGSPAIHVSAASGSHK